MRLAPDGNLLDLRVVESRETPAYMGSLAPWLRGLRGHGLFETDALRDVDAVTGATLTSAAILQTLRISGQLFGEQVFGRQAAADAVSEPQQGGWRPFALVTLAALAVALRFRPSRRRRWWFLVATLLVSGLWLNAQFSLAHVLSLARMQLPPGRTTALILVAGVPLLVALFGNVYCGYLCPFGALQELAGRLRPASWRAGPGAFAWRWGRLVKYALLAAIVILFAVTLDSRLASPDPLVTAFARRRAGLTALWAAGLVALGIVYGRFWCRTLCPVGAFLSLLNGLRLLRRFIPSVHPGRCPYGVTGTGELDCICCDRCRLAPETEPVSRDATQPRAVTGWRGAVFLLLAAALALGLFRTMTAASKRGGPGTREGTLRARSGAMRQVDMSRLRARIRRGELSDREAMHYVPVPGPDNP